MHPDTKYDIPEDLTLPSRLKWEHEIVDGILARALLERRWKEDEEYEIINVAWNEEEEAGEGEAEGEGTNDNKTKLDPNAITQGQESQAGQGIEGLAGMVQGVEGLDRLFPGIPSASAPLLKDAEVAAAMSSLGRMMKSGFLSLSNSTSMPPNLGIPPGPPKLAVGGGDGTSDTVGAGAGVVAPDSATKRDSGGGAASEQTQTQTKDADGDVGMGVGDDNKAADGILRCGIGHRDKGAAVPPEEEGIGPALDEPDTEDHDGDIDMDSEGVPLMTPAILSQSHESAGEGDPASMSSRRASRFREAGLVRFDQEKLEQQEKPETAENMPQGQESAGKADSPPHAARPEEGISHLQQKGPESEEKPETQEKPKDKGTPEPQKKPDEGKQVITENLRTLRSGRVTKSTPSPPKGPKTKPSSPKRGRKGSNATTVSHTGGAATNEPIIQQQVSDNIITTAGPAKKTTTFEVIPGTGRKLPHGAVEMAMTVDTKKSFMETFGSFSSSSVGRKGSGAESGGGGGKGAWWRVCSVCAWKSCCGCKED